MHAHGLHTESARRVQLQGDGWQHLASWERTRTFGEADVFQLGTTSAVCGTPSPEAPPSGRTVGPGRAPPQGSHGDVRRHRSRLCPSGQGERRLGRSRCGVRARRVGGSHPRVRPGRGGLRVDEPTPRCGRMQSDLRRRSRIESRPALSGARSEATRRRRGATRTSSGWSSLTGEVVRGASPDAPNTGRRDPRTQGVSRQRETHLLDAKP